MKAFSVLLSYKHLPDTDLEAEIALMSATKHQEVVVWSLTEADEGEQDERSSWYSESECILQCNHKPKSIIGHKKIYIFYDIQLNNLHPHLASVNYVAVINCINLSFKDVCNCNYNSQQRSELLDARLKYIWNVNKCKVRICYKDIDGWVPIACSILDLVPGRGKLPAQTQTILLSKLLPPLAAFIST